MYVHDFETPDDVTFAIVDLPTLLAYLTSPALLSTLTYNPSTDLYGPLSLTYTATDPQGLSSSITQPAFLAASEILCPAPERRCPGGHCSTQALCLPVLQLPAAADPYTPRRDTTPPQLTVLGSAPAHVLVAYGGAGTVMETRVPVGHAYVDPGATAFDAAEGYLTEQVTARGAAAVQTALPTPEGRPFGITYTVADSAGNVAAALRSVYVDCPLGRRLCMEEASGAWYCSLDPEVCVGAAAAGLLAPPVATELSLLGAAEVWVTVGMPYGKCPTASYPLLLSCDPGAVAVHAQEGDVSDYITACGERYLFTEYGVTACGINTAVVGEYTVAFAVVDSGSGVPVEARRTLHVVAQLPEGVPSAEAVLAAESTSATDEVLLLSAASAPVRPSGSAAAWPAPTLQLKPVGAQGATVAVPHGWAYRACGDDSIQTPATPCEAGTLFSGQVHPPCSPVKHQPRCHALAA